MKIRVSVSVVGLELLTVLEYSLYQQHPKHLLISISSRLLCHRLEDKSVIYSDFPSCVRTSQKVQQCSKIQRSANRKVQLRFLHHPFKAA